MDETITLSRASFFELLSLAGKPNPDDPGDPNNPFGPFGPGGPISFEHSWVLLNPQPLPPRWLDQLGSIRQRGPQPDPWRAKAAVHWVVGYAMTQYQLAEVISGEEYPSRSIEIISRQLHEIIDDWCGTGRPRWPWPRPRPHPDSDAVDPVGLLLAGQEFQRLADSLVDNPLQGEFASLSAQLFDVGLSNLSG